MINMAKLTTRSKILWPGLVFLIGAFLLTSCSSSSSSKQPSAATKTISESIVSAPIRVISTSDGQVGYRSIGSGPPIVMIMGFSSSMDGWPPNFVDSLAADHEVITFDNSGIGKTSLPTGVLSVGTMANQTNAFIQALHLKHPIVLGWSMGGMIAQSLAVKFPQDVSKLILCATLPGNGKATPPTQAATAALANPTQATAVSLLDLLFPPNQQAREIPAFTKEISQYPSFYLASSNVDQLQLSALGKWFTGGDGSGRHISGIRAKTLIGDGSNDILIPSQNDYEMNHVIKHSKLVMYPDAGHGFLFQDANAWSQQILKFIKN